MERIEEKEGRRLFGSNADLYREVRPAYPDSVYSLIVSEGALYPGATTLEVGAGSGVATRRLIELGAAPLTLVEPDARFAPLLRELGSRLSADTRILQCGFEDAELGAEHFDLVVAATSFHWLDARTRVGKLARSLRPSGYVALLWNLFQDTARSDDFHAATRHLLSHLASSPSGEPGKLPFALDRVEREREFVDDGLFQLAAFLDVRWTLVLTAQQVRKLYQSFASIARLPEAEREALLSRLVEISTVEFGGTVVRNMTTVVYLFKRHPARP